jgi:catechol 2,3-dioxygenase-like lactoylglutathione lyase family enzyme
MMIELPVDQQITFFMVKDLDATADFYERVLGLLLAVDQGSCRIYQVVGQAYIGFCERPDSADSTRNVILTLVTPEVDAWYKHLRARGLSPENPPAVNPTYRIYHFYLRDPDGYLVEIQRFLDPVMGDARAGQTRPDRCDR